MDLLQGQLSDGLLDTLTSQLGGADKQQTSNAADGIMDALVGAMAKNASTPEGASALNNALENDHDGSIFDNLGDFLGGNKANVQCKNSKRRRNFRPYFGAINKAGVIDMVSKNSGLDSGKIGGLMATLAPVVMGALGKTKKASGLDAGSLVGMLAGVVGQRKAQSPIMGMVTGFLDKDGDGSFIDDVAGGLAGKLLGGLFGKK